MRTLTAGTAQKIKFSIKNFFSKCDQIRNFQQIWSHVLKKSLMESLNFCALRGVFRAMSNIYVKLFYKNNVHFKNLVKVSNYRQIVILMVTWCYYMNISWYFRSSPSEVFLMKGVLKIYSKFTGEHPYQSVISIKMQSNFIEITLQHGCSPVNFLHIFRRPFSKNTSG